MHVWVNEWLICCCMKCLDSSLDDDDNLKKNILHFCILI